LNKCGFKKANGQKRDLFERLDPERIDPQGLYKCAVDGVEPVLVQKGLQGQFFEAVRSLFTDLNIPLLSYLG
jgi:hypothetical protein